MRHIICFVLCALCFVLSVRLFSKLCALLRHFFSLPIEKKKKKERVCLLVDS